MNRAKPIAGVLSFNLIILFFFLILVLPTGPEVHVARLKDGNKKNIIIQSSKMLFAHKGFYNTSISDIAQETGLPIGSIYTYFKSKDQIISTLVEEGWEELYAKLRTSISNDGSPKDKLRSIIEDFIPVLLDDMDLINIILTETLAYTRIEEKIEKLTELIFQLLLSISTESKIPSQLTKKDMETALIIYFMGILSTAKLTRSSAISVNKEDIIHFLKNSVEQTMGIKI
jgi:AcrR family transcriptional regulator